MTMLGSAFRHASRTTSIHAGPTSSSSSRKARRGPLAASAPRFRPSASPSFEAGRQVITGRVSSNAAVPSVEASSTTMISKWASVFWHRSESMQALRSSRRLKVFTTTEMAGVGSVPSGSWRIHALPWRQRVFDDGARTKPYRATDCCLGSSLNPGSSILQVVERHTAASSRASHLSHVR